MIDISDIDALAKRWESARSSLSSNGFNLTAALDPQALPGDLVEQLGDDRVTPVVLVAAGGRDLWRTMTNENSQTGAEPVDEFSIRRISAVLQRHLPGVSFEFAYPGTGSAPLIALGEYLGWSRPSPLGLGINPEFGLWFAYRALLRVHAALPHTLSTELAAPCDNCTSRDCVAACPVDAVSQVGKFSIDRCADFRLRPASACQMTCLARLACPVGVQHQYTELQFSHHQGRSLDGLKRWLNKS